MVKAHFTPAPKPTVPEGQVTISMPVDFAITLIAIGMRVGGHPVTTRRGHVDIIKKTLQDVLREQGINVETTVNLVRYENGMRPGIYFGKEF